MRPDHGTATEHNEGVWLRQAARQLPKQLISWQTRCQGKAPACWHLLEVASWVHRHLHHPAPSSAMKSRMISHAVLCIDASLRHNDCRARNATQVTTVNTISKLARHQQMETRLFACAVPNWSSEGWSMYGIGLPADHLACCSWKTSLEIWLAYTWTIFSARVGAHWSGAPALCNIDVLSTVSTPLFNFCSFYESKLQTPGELQQRFSIFNRCCPVVLGSDPNSSCQLARFVA